MANEPKKFKCKDEERAYNKGHAAGLADGFDSLPSKVTPKEDSWYSEGYRAGYKEETKDKEKKGKK